MKHLLTLSLVLTLLLGSSFVVENGTNSSAENPADDGRINWITMQELNEIAQSGDWEEKKKKVFIDLYTDWCGWCKKMDKTTFRDPRIVKYMNENYYAVKFDAETKKTIQFGNKEYKWVPGGRNGINQLARELGVKGYPSYAFLNENLAKIQVVSGYQKVPTMLQMLVYFSEDQHQKTPWPKFRNNFDMNDYEN